jgi:predicted aspartyl protease
MNVRRLQRLTGFVFGTLIIGSLHLLQPPTSHASSKDNLDMVSFKLGESGLIYVAVTINGKTPLNFVLDTGANRSSITASVAARLDLRPVAVSGLVTSASERSVHCVRFDTIEMGSLTRNGLLATVIADTDAAAIGRNVDGIIGQDVLGDSNYTLDYDHKHLVWDVDETLMPAGTRLSMRQDEGRWLVALPQDRKGGEIVWFVPDSGATTLVVFDRGVAVPLRWTRLPEMAPVLTVSGGNQFQSVVLQQLRVGKIVLQNRPTLLIDRRDPDAPAGDGLLPLSAFSSVTFNTREGYLVVRAK